MATDGYRASLATMQVGSGCVIVDDRGRVLLVKPTYKDGWEIPGGAAEAGESPLDACRREVREELGHDIVPDRLLGVDYRAPVDGLRGDALRFVFAATLTPDQIASITLPPDELSEWRFVDLDDLDGYVIAPMARRLRSLIRGAGEGYLEEGRPPII
jgi:8-oxo-dGTP diphosphatase